MARWIVSLTLVLLGLAVTPSAHAWVQDGPCVLHVYTPGINSKGQRYGRERVDSCRPAAFATRQLHMEVCLQDKNGTRWASITCWVRGPFRALILSWPFAPHWDLTTSAVWIHGWLRDWGWLDADNHTRATTSTALYQR